MGLSDSQGSLVTEGLVCKVMLLGRRSLDYQGVPLRVVLVTFFGGSLETTVVKTQIWSFPILSAPDSRCNHVFPLAIAICNHKVVHGASSPNLYYVCLDFGALEL